MDPDSAQDAAQEATLRAWRRSATCAGAPEAWIKTIARREALRIAARRREECLPDGAEVSVETDDPELALERQELITVLSCLPAAQQQVIFLRYWADKTEAEIAAGSNTPVGTIKIRLHRARARLAQELRDTASS